MPTDKFQSIEIQGTNQGRQITVSGKATHVEGRAARIDIQVPFAGPIKVTTVGKDRLTSAEGQREDIILKALQSTSAIADQPFFRAIWLPRETPAWPTGPSFLHSIPASFSRPLNDSQRKAVGAILSTQPITVIHGPPGTGKTTVIAAAVTSIATSAAWDRSLWLVAQSNVAVKNIAEKLASVGFLDFKILVSRGNFIVTLREQYS